MGFKLITWNRYVDWDSKSSEFLIIDDDFEWTGVGKGPGDRGGDAIIKCYRKKGLPVAENLVRYIQWCDKQNNGFPAERVLKTLSENPSFKPYENEVRKILFHPIDPPKPMTTQIRDISNPLGKQISIGLLSNGNLISSEDPTILAVNGDRVLLGWKKVPESRGYFRPWSDSTQARELREDIRTKKYSVFDNRITDGVSIYNAASWVDNSTLCTVVSAPKQDTTVAEKAPTNTKTTTNEFPLGSKVSYQGQPNIKDGVVIGKFGQSMLVGSSTPFEGGVGFVLKDSPANLVSIGRDFKSHPENYVSNALEYKFASWLDPNYLSARDSLPEEINQAPTPAKTDKFQLGDRVSFLHAVYADELHKGTVIGKYVDATGLSYLIGSNTEKIGFPLKGIGPSEETIKRYINAHPENFAPDAMTYQNARWVIENQLIIDNLPKYNEKVSLPTYDTQDDYKRKLDRAYKLATDLIMSGYGTDERMLDGFSDQKAIFIQKIASPTKSPDAISKQVNAIMGWNEPAYNGVLDAWNHLKVGLQSMQKATDAIVVDQKKKDEEEYKAKLSAAYKLAHEIERSSIDKHAVGFENGSSIEAMANRIMKLSEYTYASILGKVGSWNASQAKELAAKQELERQSSFGYVLKHETKEAGYRIVATQITKGIKNGILALLKDKGTEEGKLQAISDLLDTEIGGALISELLGHGLPHIPKIKDDPRIKKLCSEFRIGGYTTIGNSITDQLITYILPAITGALSNLPSETENIRVAEEPKRIEEVPKEEPVQEELLEEVLQNTSALSL